MPVNIKRYILRAGKISIIAHVNNFIIYFPTLRQVDDLIRLDHGSIARLLSFPLGGNGLHHTTNDSTMCKRNCVNLDSCKMKKKIYLYDSVCLSFNLQFLNTHRYMSVAYKAMNDELIRLEFCTDKK